MTIRHIRNSLSHTNLDLIGPEEHIGLEVADGLVDDVGVGGAWCRPAVLGAQWQQGHVGHQTRRTCVLRVVGLRRVGPGMSLVSSSGRQSDSRQLRNHRSKFNLRQHRGVDATALGFSKNNSRTDRPFVTKLGKPNLWTILYLPWIF